MKWRSQVIWIVLLVLIAAASLVMLPSYGGQDVDQFWLRWIRDAETHGLVRGYEASKLDYPPLSVAMMWLFSKSAALAGVSTHMGLKLGLLLFMWATTAICMATTRNLKLSTLLAAGLILNSVCLAYVDVLFMPPLILGLWLLAAGRPATGLFFFTVSCLIKYQPLIIAPFLVLHLWRTKQLSLRTVITSAVPVLACVAIYGSEVFVTLGRALNHLYLSAYAFNVNWVVTRIVESGGLETPFAMRFGMVYLTQTVSVVTKILFLVFYAYLLLAHRRDDFVRVLKMAVVSYVAYFVLCTGVHENHLILAVPAAVLAAHYDPKWVKHAFVVTAFSTINMLYVYGSDGSGGLVDSGSWLDVGLSLGFAAWFAFLVRPYLRRRNGKLAGVTSASDKEDQSP